MTVRIALLVTGTLEERGLVRALERIFAGRDVEFSMSPRQDGFTSVASPAPGAERPTFLGRSTVEKLANRLIADADPGRSAKAEPPDFVVLLEDVEICNLHQVGAVVGHFAAAVQHELAGDVSPRGVLRAERVRERCSFHLVSPMIESYFFRDVERVRPQVALQREPHEVLAAQDVEFFDVSEEAHFCTHACPRGKDYWSNAGNNAGSARARHPKHYLHYLADPDAERRIQEVYKESRQGAEILRTLEWASVFEGQRDNLTLLRAMLDDIAEMIGCASPYPGVASPHTALITDGRVKRVLRNVRAV
jgi:hypothetical protein